jgi:hypothetical protein
LIENLGSFGHNNKMILRVTLYCNVKFGGNNLSANLMRREGDFARRRPVMLPGRSPVERMAWGWAFLPLVLP